VSKVPSPRETSRAAYVEQFHGLYFKLACHEKTASEFQSFFECIMEKHDPSFIRVKPSGREGDWKCDGFSQETGTVYQCYAPENLTAAKAAAKVREDFDGAKEKWGSNMKRWVFVWSSGRALPPQVVQLLQQLKEDHADVAIDDWNREALWQIVRALPVRDRDGLLGPAPDVTLAADTTAAEIQVLLDFLVSHETELADGGLDHLGLEDKIRRNGLTHASRVLIQTGLPVARVAEEYLKRHPDLEFADKIARALARKYDEIATEASPDADTTFLKLVRHVRAQNDGATAFWAAVGIVTYCFQLCDIFES